ncbi:MAG: GTPase HflX [Candidatus Bathyarchaeia archaeon]
MVQRRLQSERSSLDELQSLAKSAGYTVVDEIEQVREADPRYQIGSGKAKELVDLVAKYNAEKLIFDNELKPVQAYNLAKTTGVEAIDRFQLILEIFSKRASTAEAKLQIQLARLRYELARAKERVKLARMEEQPGFMGLGRYEVDLYHETVRRRIRSIRDKLKKIRKKRGLHRARRLELGFSILSLAGYTNAGKSSLFNILAGEEVPVDSTLFTTLSTKTSTVVLSARKVLLTDTVGFIDRLPLKLIEAFRSTLEETIFSDVILLVVDLSEPIDEIKRKLSVCLDTIQKIGATGIRIITALNKIDLLEDSETAHKTETLRELAPNSVPISALHKTNTALLRKQIIDNLEEYTEASFSLPMEDKSMSFLSWLFNRVDVHEVKYRGDSMDVHFESIPWFADKVKERVKELGGTFNASF